jgi:hypothetical protein
MEGTTAPSMPTLRIHSPHHTTGHRTEGQHPTDGKRTERKEREPRGEHDDPHDIPGIQTTYYNFFMGVGRHQHHTTTQPSRPPTTTPGRQQTYTISRKRKEKKKEENHHPHIGFSPSFRADSNRSGNGRANVPPNRMFSFHSSSLTNPQYLQEIPFSFLETIDIPAMTTGAKAYCLI